MQRLLKTARITGMLVLMLVTALAIHIPFQEYYNSETLDERPAYKDGLLLKATVLKQSQMVTKVKATGNSLPLLFLMMSAALLQQTLKSRLPYRSIIPLRLRLLLLFPIKFTSKFV